MIYNSIKYSNIKYNLNNDYNKLFLKNSYNIYKQKWFKIGYPLYYRKAYYFCIYGYSIKYTNNIKNSNQILKIITNISKNKILFCIPISINDLLII